MTVERARAHLDDAATGRVPVRGRRRGEYNALLGYNGVEAASVSLDELLGVLILPGASGHDIHPAVLGHVATEHAVRNYED